MLYSAPHPDIAALKTVLKKQDNFELESYNIRDFKENIAQYNLVILHQLPDSRNPIPELIKELIQIIEPITDFSPENLQTVIKGWITAKEIGFGKVMQPLRLSLVGAMKGPDVFDIMSLLGKDNTIERLHAIIK